MEQTITLSGKDLADLDSEFGRRFGPNQSVDAVFTTDKSSTEWYQDRDEGTMGFLHHVDFQDGLRAYGLVYILAPNPSSITRPAAGRINPLAPPGAPTKELVLQTLVHELVHVRQAWLHGGQSDFRAVYLKEFSRAKGAYSANRFEQFAFKIADAFVAAHRLQISRGRFDQYLPSWLLTSRT